MNKTGFTLVELLAVIVILAILVIIALPNVLKMFNDAKKNSFVTETKTVYSEVSKKYISESMKGNKLTYVSSEDDTKLEMTGRDLQYCVFLNDDGTIKSMKVSNGEYIAELPSGKKIIDLKSTDLKNGNLDDYDCANPFKSDSWEEIAANAKICINDEENCPYDVGDEKEVDVGTYGRHKIRIANMSTPNECNDSDFSQSACGFVLEFVDVIAAHNMNPAEEYKGKSYDVGWNKDGWPESKMYKFLNDEDLDGTNDKELSIMKALPNDLKNVIIDTKTVSGRGNEDTVEYFTSTDKLYLLGPKEIYSDWSNQYALEKDFTRQLDYYNMMKVSSKSNVNPAIKKSGETEVNYWLRTANTVRNYYFYRVNYYGPGSYGTADGVSGVSPAFRIG